jgi:hypothetical protein
MKVRNVGVGRVWDCILCTCVSEEGWDVEGVDSEASSLLSYTLRYVMGIIFNVIINLSLRLQLTSRRMRVLLIR